MVPTGDTLAVTKMTALAVSILPQLRSICLVYFDFDDGPMRANWSTLWSVLSFHSMENKKKKEHIFRVKMMDFLFIVDIFHKHRGVYQYKDKIGKLSLSQ